MSTARVLHVDGNAASQPAATGARRRPFRTITAAAALAGPGDTVLVHPGIYRERVAPPRGGSAGRPLTFRSAVRHAAVIRGSAVFRGPSHGHDGLRGVLRLELAGMRLGAGNPFARSLQHRPGQTLGQVILDGAVLRERPEAGAVESLPGSWRALDGSALLLHLPEGMDGLRGHLLELAVRPRCFAPRLRGLGHITVEDFIIEHGCNDYCSGFWLPGERPQTGLLGCRSGHHWLISGNLIRHAKTFAIDLGYEGPTDGDGLKQAPGAELGHHEVIGNRIEANGAGGIIGCGAPAVRIAGNVIVGNETLATGADESAGIKLHFSFDARIEGNLIQGNDCPGIWLDHHWRGARVTRNVILDNAGAGIFVELGDGPLLIDGNVIGHTRPTMALAGDGIYAHDASGVTVAHNLLWFNGNCGLWTHVGSDRPLRFFVPPGSPGAAPLEPDGLYRHLAVSPQAPWWIERPSACQRWTVLNNLVAGNPRAALSLPPEMPRSEGCISDRNVLCSGYDLAISETWGSPLDAPALVCNTNKERMPIAELRRRAGLPPAWERMPLLDLATWRTLTGRDLGSVVPVLLRPRLGLAELVLDLIIDDACERIRCRPVPGVDADFHGRPMPERPLAGPFQDLRACRRIGDGGDYATPGRGPFEQLPEPGADEGNRIVLWPPAA